MTKKKKVKRMKDPNAPKRALSGFFWFSNEERPKVQAANPDFKVQLKNIAKGTTDPRVEFILQVLTQILIKFHLHKSTSKSQLNTNISTKAKLKDIDQT